MRLLRFFLIVGAATAASAQQGPALPAGATWRGIAERDLAAAKAAVQQTYIYAVRPDGARFAATLARADGRARRDVGRVDGFGAYRAVLKRYAAAFRDPHLTMGIDARPPYRWPGIVLGYRDGHWRVVRADPATGAADGAIVTACDGRPVADLARRYLADTSALPALEAERARSAPYLLLDQGSPFYRVPRRCTIGGVRRPLRWMPVDQGRWLEDSGVWRGVGAVPVGLSDFGDGGAWIRLPSMSPSGAAQTAAYRAVIAAGPSLRDRKAIVFDVRGNGGGQYEWFVAMLRSLYGAPYADRYVRERLRIRPVFVGRLPGGDGPPPPAAATAPDPDEPPRDDALQDLYDDVRTVTTPAGQVVTLVDVKDRRRVAPPPGPAPRSPVRAPVFVLIDSGCFSACLSFLDEMRAIPGVRFVGLPTLGDRRSGNPVPHPLPSGFARILIPSMVRLGRARGENVPFTPDIRYRGDILDTAAVQRWITGIVASGAPPSP